jgi:thiosulfate reductase cytochrome b subunit
MQAFLILSMVFTGLEIHGVYSVFGFEKAVTLHNVAAASWGVLIIMMFTWIFSTGEWKQYLPTADGLFATAKFYMFGIFKGEKHPHKKNELNKLNPLQRLTYLGLMVGLIPAQIVTGILYISYHQWHWVGLAGHIDLIAYAHTFIAYSILSFVIVHVYMTTMGHTLTAHIKAMITGYEDLDAH